MSIRTAGTWAGILIATGMTGCASTGSTGLAANRPISTIPTRANPNPTAMTANNAAGAVRLRASNGRPIEELTNYKGTLFFTVDTGDVTRIWKTNGTVADVQPFSGGSTNNLFNVRDLTLFKGGLYFAADDGQIGSELWKTNGTTSGTVLVKDIRPEDAYYGSPIDSSPRELTNVLGTLFFSATDGVAQILGCG